MFLMFIPERKCFYFEKTNTGLHLEQEKFLKVFTKIRIIFMSRVIMNQNLNFSSVLPPRPVPAGGQSGILSETMLQNKQIKTQMNPETS